MRVVVRWTVPGTYLSREESNTNILFNGQFYLYIGSVLKMRAKIHKAYLST